jgi:hypothetical protein
MPPAWTLVPPLWRLKILKILMSMQQRLMVLLLWNCLSVSWKATATQESWNMARTMP